MIITIDSGTTNTRLTLFDTVSKKHIDRIKLSVGVRDNVLNERNSTYKIELKNAITDIIKRNSLKKEDISKIIASGMICSEIGLCNIPHIEAPADIKKLKLFSKTLSIADVCDIPITFIPGVKNTVNKITVENIDDFDMMRGEETEVFGIMELLKLEGNFTAILPGSHTKLIKISPEGKIDKCQTTIAGELLSCVSQNTIIKKTLPEGLSKDIDEECLKTGYLLSKKNGFNNTAFKVRCAGLFAGLSSVQLSSFFTGAALADDIELIKDFSQNTNFVIGGSEPLKSIFKVLVTFAVPNAKVLSVDNETVNNCTAAGACAIAGY